MTEPLSQVRALQDPQANAVTVVEYLTTMLAEMDRRYQQRYENQVAALGAALTAQEKAVQAALLSVDKAITKAEVATERRFDSVNEFRQTLSDQTKTFIGKPEFDALRETNSERIRLLAERLDRMDGKSAGLNAGWGYVIGLIGLVAGIISILVKFN